MTQRIAAGVVASTLISIALAVSAHGDPLVYPSPAITEAMGGTDQPVLSDARLQELNTLLIQPNLPGTDAETLYTPEQFAPVVGTMTLDQSVAQGVNDLDAAITPMLNNNTAVGVFGVSQSALIASDEMRALDPSGTPSDLPASFILLADPMNPNGGLWERLDGLSIPLLGVTLNGATPADDFPTVIYSDEYDLASDFCQYPIDVVCDVNALAGFFIAGVHASVVGLDDAVQLSTQGATETTYYMIPDTGVLPILEPLQYIPTIGPALIDLLQPDMTAIVNWGYGDPDYGWSLDPANIATPAELLPPLDDTTQLLTALIDGTQLGVQDFIADLTALTA
jgi:PE-PPE domain